MRPSGSLRRLILWPANSTWRSGLSLQQGRFLGQSRPPAVVLGLPRFYSTAFDTRKDKETGNKAEADKKAVSNAQQASNSDSAKDPTTSGSDHQNTSPPGQALVVKPPGGRLSRLQAKEELLRRSKTFLGRLGVRFKWLMIRQQKRFNTDDFSALFSWIIWGHILWIVLGTTTFISLLIWGLSKVRAQDFLAKWVSNLVTKETGLRVIFEEAMVPDWKQGVIIMRKVFVSRRPGNAPKAKVGSQSDAAAEAAASQRNDGRGAVTDSGNYTQFDLTMDSVAVTLSVSRWLAGNGLLRTVEIKGLRGVVDRRHVKWDPNDDPTRHKSKPKNGDFNFELFKMEDVMVQIHQPGVSRPFKLCIYSCELPRLRKQWLFYDFMNASNMSGSYDDSLFTLHPRQLDRPMTQNDIDNGYRRIQRLRIDKLNIRHLNRHDTGMFGWIDNGKVDFLADIMLPTRLEELPFREKVQDVLERWESTIVNGRPKDGEEIVTTVQKRAQEREAHKLVLIDLRVQFNDTRASAPFYTSDLTYMNNALIHPVVAYINSRDTYIPVHCRVVKRVLDFDGSWTVYDSTLMNDVSKELYDACVRDMADEDARRRRIRKVGFYSLQFLAQLVLLTLGIVA